MKPTNALFLFQRPRRGGHPEAQPIPTALSDLFTSPAVADLVLAVLLLEGVGLAVWHARTGRGPRPGSVLPFLVAGGCLVLALRAALSGAAWWWMAAALLGSLAAHLWQLRVAWPEADDRRE